MELRDSLRFRYRKRLPAEFGRGSVIVTARADIRVLRPGWRACAHDLMLVADRLVNPGMCVWDIGANLGIFSAMAAFKCGPDGLVCALEAAPEYAALVVRTASELSEGYAPIQVLCAAIAEEAGILSFGIAKRGHARSRLLDVSGDSDFDVSSVHQVVALSGDALLEAWPAPSLVKLDVEGAELIALQGSRRLLTEARPIFYLEVSPWNQRAVTEHLHAHRYSIFELKGDGREAPADICSFYSVARPLD